MQEKIKKAYYLIHDNLSYMPNEYCCWKKKSRDGRTITKTLSGDYRPMFFFMYNNTIRNNVAELRMCLDYHHSLYKLHKPGLTFGWQHKLVLCQIVAGICEGLLFDFFEYKTSQNNRSIGSVLAKQKLDSKSFGFGSLIDIFFQSKDLDEKWYNYLIKLKYLRDTIHPKSLNVLKASFQENSIVRGSIDLLIKNLESFTVYIKKRY